MSHLYTTRPQRIRYAETDQMGFSHHSNYLKYFELARLEWLLELGVSYKELEQKGYLLAVVQAEVNFVSPAFFEDEFTVTVQLKSPPTASMLFSYEMHNQHGKLNAKGTTKLAFLDAQSKRPVRCPEELSSMLASLFE
ncbi:MAG: acyl-CoA thioesterase [Flavobacteriaceae bacterium]